MYSLSIASLFDRFMNVVGPAPGVEPAPVLPPPTLAEIMALAAVPEAGSSAWFLLIDMLDHQQEPPESLR